MSYLGQPMLEPEPNSTQCSCSFCNEFAHPTGAPNRKAWEGQGWVLLPSLGSFTPGYLLLMPHRHVRSFAELSPDEFGPATSIAEHARCEIFEEFGPTIIAEHGSGTPQARSAACCDHAHWHLIPADIQRVAAMYEAAGGPPVLLTNVGHLTSWAAKSYIYLSPLKGVHWVWPYSQTFPSQFVRRVCASSRGIGDFYDWALFPFAENMLVTRQRLGARLKRALGDSVPSGPSSEASCA